MYTLPFFRLKAAPHNELTMELTLEPGAETHRETRHMDTLPFFRLKAAPHNELTLEQGPETQTNTAHGHTVVLVT